MSVRLGIFLHHLEELFKQVVRVVRTRRCLRMVLHAESRQGSMLHAFDSLVVEVDVRDSMSFRFRLSGSTAKP